MEQSVEEMYRDALAVTGLQEALWWSSQSVPQRMGEYWERASERIGDLIPRLGQVNMDAAKELMQIWKECREAGEDFRVLTALIDSVLIPAVKNALCILYTDLEFEAGAYSFQKNSFGFFAARDLRSGKFLHEPSDPMREAAELARSLYRGEYDEFLILGSGLGYLAWQIWERSEHTTRILLFEEDALMLDYAFRIGVLSLIDPEYLVVADSTDREAMLRAFAEHVGKPGCGYHVSDWKRGAYADCVRGDLIDALEADGRTDRRVSLRQTINMRENKKRLSGGMADLKALPGMQKKEAVVISAGPSLNDNIAFLRESVGKRTLIAVNAAVRRLEKEGIRADVIVMLDPLDSLKSHIEGLEEYSEGIPLVTVPEGSCSYVKLYRGPVYCIRDEDAYPWSFGQTVASMGLDLAYFFGAESVYLVGSDLAYPRGENYAAGVAHSVKEGITGGVEVPGADGEPVKTNLLYVSYRKVLERQIAAHPKVKVYNMSAHGARIEGALAPKREA